MDWYLGFCLFVWMVHLVVYVNESIVTTNEWRHFDASFIPFILSKFLIYLILHINIRSSLISLWYFTMNSFSVLSLSMRQHSKPPNRTIFWFQTISCFFPFFHHLFIMCVSNHLKNLSWQFKFSTYSNIALNSHRNTNNFFYKLCITKCTLSVRMDLIAVHSAKLQWLRFGFCQSLIQLKILAQCCFFQ